MNGPLETAEDYREAVELLKQASAAYYSGNTVLMDDASYDALLHKVGEAEEQNPSWLGENGAVSQQVAAGAGITGDVTHNPSMLSLDNVFDEEELKAWYSKLTKALGNEPEAVVVEPKFDGMALSVIYREGRLQRIATRGDGNTGEDITHSSVTIRGLPRTLKEKVDIEVRGEALMTAEDFEEANKIRAKHNQNPLVNPRNGAAGALRAMDKPYSLPLTFYGYDVVQDTEDHTESLKSVEKLGIQTSLSAPVKGVRVTGLKAMLEAVENINTKRSEIDLSVDGAVIKVEKQHDRRIGFTAKAPRWAIAYKYPAELRISTLKGVTLQVGRTGVITPVAELEPVFVGGTTISRVTLHNPSEIQRKDLRIGDKVWVRRAGEVIPEIVGVVEDSRTEELEIWKAPTSCGKCGGRIDKSSRRWRCANGENCGRAELLQYAASRKALDIDGLGSEVVIALLKGNHIKDVGDLYTLNEQTLGTLELSGRKLGEKTAVRIAEQSKLAQTRDLDRHLTALGILYLGRRLSRTLAENFGNMQAIENATIEDIAALEGFGPERARSVFEGILRSKPVIEKMRKAGVNLEYQGVKPAEQNNTHALTGKSIVLTGSHSTWKREELAEHARALGIKVGSSVSKNTSLVVYGEKPGSKLAKAQDLGVETQTMEEFATKTLKLDV